MHHCVECRESAQGRRCAACGAAILAGRYRISSLLSRSPHARIYSALTPEGVSVALKELSFALVPSARQLEAFEREARALERIDHSAVPRFVEAFREGEGAEVRLYLVQQLIEGTSLHAMLPQHRFSEAEARDIARKVLLVLSDLHDAGVIHRDLKPANILKREDGSVALVDFGVARLPDRSRGTTVAGTFGFAAPEALAGVADSRSDLYSLGATLVALLARRDPAEMLGPDLGLRIDGHLAISADLRAFLARLTARDRGLRYASARDALAALDGPRTPARSVRKRATLFALMLAAVALAGVGFWRTRARTSGKAAIPQVSAAHTRRPIDGPLPPFIFPIQQGWTDLPGTFGGQVQARWHTSSGDCATLTLVRLSRFAHMASGRDREEVQFFATFGDEEDRCEGPATGTFFRLLDDTGRECVRFESRPIAGRGDEPLVFHAAFYAPAGSHRLHLVGGEFARPQVEYALDLVANVVQEWRQ